MIKTVRDKLYTVLQTLEGSTKPLKQVFNYFEPSPQQFPCAMVRISGVGTETRLDSANNVLQAEFTIRVLLQADNTLAAEDQRIDLIDSIAGAFRSATNVDTLGGIVEKFDIGSIVAIEASEQFPVFGFDLVVNASKIMSIS